MNVLVRALAAPPGDVEIVEHKGRGHPDSLCDAVAEAASQALSRAYLERFGRVLHHNVDKALLVGGRARAAFGGGEVTEPIVLYIAGRAAEGAGGARVPVRDIVVEAARSVLRETLHALDVDRHVRVEALVRPGSADLVSLFEHPHGVARANDTSCGVGYAPLSDLERAVLAVSDDLAAMSASPAGRAVGEDVKVMAVREGRRVDLTVGCAFIGRELGDLGQYFARREAVRAEVARRAQRALGERFAVDAIVNAADGASEGEIYLTVTGTSAEAGDDGEVGRGNRVNGLITPYRPMTLEAASGKNAISHVGKLYNLAARDLAGRLVAELREIAHVECALVSRIGRPVTDPVLTDIRVSLREGAELAAVRERIEGVTEAELARIPTLWERLLRGEIRVF